ncbi:MAG: GAF domain-containing protein [Phaeospirillum sp.]|nr:GAF domain-containing protein [Phaeospirillum sp.]
MLLSFWLGAANEQRQALDLATHEARSNVLTDIGFRQWASSHGGVYVPPDAETPPNPYLNVPDRDVVTTTGKKLTLMNPAYMLRQLMQRGFVARGRITSARPLNPDNAPDEWEAAALARLDAGASEVAETVTVDGQPAMRLMLPIRVEAGCLKCHGHQGYKVGDLRGGINVTVPMAPFTTIMRTETWRLAIGHGLIWLFVLIGIGLVAKGGQTRILRQKDVERRLLITQFSVNRADDAIYWLTPSGQISYVNDAACALLGYDHAELLRMHAADLNPCHPRERWEAHWDDLKQRGSLRFETELRCKDGSLLPVEISANFLSYGSEQFDVAFVRDMRDHKAAEAQITHLKDVYAALSQTNQSIVRCRNRQDLFDSIVKIAVDFGHFRMAWIGFPDEKTKAVHPMAWAGEGSDYLDGLIISTDADSPYGQGPTGRAIRTGEHCIIERFASSPSTMPWHQRAAACGFKSSAAFPLFNQGRTVGALTIYSGEEDFFTPDLIGLLKEMAFDISFALDGMDLEASHRRQEEELREMVERLTVSNTELERFAYVASHDLQEPLRTIVAFTQLVERGMGTTLPATERENFAFVIDAAKRMHLLIQDLLAFSRISSKGAAFSRVSLRDACAAAIDNLRESISDSGAEVTVGELPEVMGDGVQLMQVFQNLIGNAVKFRYADRLPQVSVTAEWNNNEWVITVADNGIGIGNTEQDIFEIFRRLHSGPLYPGSGVGLAICKRIVHRHNGRIWVDSAEGAGSSFHFSLPATLG